MKVLCVSRMSAGRVAAVAGADSALLRPGEPVFVPDNSGKWLTAVAPAVRIDRLGTSIRADHARRYYSSIAPFHLMWPDGCDDVAGLPPFALDRALAPGDFIALDELGESVDMTVLRSPIGSDETSVYSDRFDVDALGIDSAIEQLSRYMTFKTGDLLIFTDHALPLGPTVIDTQLTVILQGTQALRIRLK